MKAAANEVTSLKTHVIPYVTNSMYTGPSFVNISVTFYNSTDVVIDIGLLKCR